MFLLEPTAVWLPVTVNVTFSSFTRPSTFAPSVLVSGSPSYTFSALGVVTVSGAGLIWYVLVTVPV